MAGLPLIGKHPLLWAEADGGTDPYEAARSMLGHPPGALAERMARAWQDA